MWFKDIISECIQRIMACGSSYLRSTLSQWDWLLPLVPVEKAWFRPKLLKIFTGEGKEKIHYGPFPVELFTFGAQICSTFLAFRKGFKTLFCQLEVLFYGGGWWDKKDTLPCPIGSNFYINHSILIVFIFIFLLFASWPELLYRWGGWHINLTNK